MSARSILSSNVNLGTPVGGTRCIGAVAAQIGNNYALNTHINTNCNTHAQVLTPTGYFNTKNGVTN
jgi:hypothetical protein